MGGSLGDRDGVIAAILPGFLAPSAMMAPMALGLARRGVQTARVSLPRLATGAVAALGDVLDAELARVCREQDAEAVDLVAVSQGAILALWWLHQRPRANVRRLVTVGGPAGGTWFAAVGVATMHVIAPGARDSLPNSTIIAAIGGRSPPGVPTTTIALTGDPVAPAARCRLVGATEIVLPRGPFWFPHQTLVFRRDVFDAIAAALQEPS